MVRVEVCGGIASGKTTLVKLFKDTENGIIIEDYESNPFWEDFYENPKKYNFETEVSFLLQHYHQIKADSPDSGVFLCDYSFVLDRAYADVGLNGSKHNAFERVYGEIRSEIGYPDLIVWLKCSAEEELRRIRNRGRSVEESIDIDFLRALNEAVRTRFEDLSQSTPSYVIDSTKHDFAHMEEEQTRILRGLKSKVSKLHH
jgi:deoxyadenosine/deoxycytidine kinase